jgi:hypothetical protein
MTKTPRSKARQKFLSVAPINQKTVIGNINRDQWLESVCQGFVSPSLANKSYYRVLLEELWPVGHGIPGPHVKEEHLREAIDRFRQSKHSSNQPYKPYVDVFRRLRELQGEEGVIGIGKQGRIYQLVNLNLSEKRIPRIKLSDQLWETVVEQYKHQCAVCGRKEPEVRFQQDHKIPRTRGGGHELENWQPLCDECNNFKSTSCRGCQLECKHCSWAFPENYAPLRLSSESITKLRKYAMGIGTDPSQLLNQIIDQFFHNTYTDT